jgi:large subunit ribosomal protein L10
MANPKILEQKQVVIDEIANNVKESNAFIFLENHGLTVEETIELRRMLRESGSELKIYKNTLVNRALQSLDIDLSSELNGPKVVAFGKDMIEPIKAVTTFAKKHSNLEMKIGIVDGKITELDELNKLATIPSREGLLTMFASGLMGVARDFAICLDLHSKNLEENK